MAPQVYLASSNSGIDTWENARKASCLQMCKRFKQAVNEVHCEEVCKTDLPPLMDASKVSALKLSTTRFPVWHVLFGNMSANTGVAPGTSTASRASTMLSNMTNLTNNLLAKKVGMASVSFSVSEITRMVTDAVTSSAAKLEKEAIVDAARWMARAVIKRAGFTQELANGSMDETISNIMNNLIDTYGEDLGDMEFDKAGNVVTGLVGSFGDFFSLAASTPTVPPLHNALFNVSLNIALGSVPIVPNFLPMMRDGHWNFSDHDPADKWAVFNYFQRMRAITSRGELRLCFFAADSTESPPQFVTKVSTMTEYYIFAPSENRFLIARAATEGASQLGLEFAPPGARPSNSGTVNATWRLLPAVHASTHNEPKVVAQFSRQDPDAMIPLKLVTGATSNTPWLNWVVKSTGGAKGGEAAMDADSGKIMLNGQMDVVLVEDSVPVGNKLDLRTLPEPLVLMVRPTNYLEEMIVETKPIPLALPDPTMHYAVPTWHTRPVDSNNLSVTINAVDLVPFTANTNVKDPTKMPFFTLLIGNKKPVEAFDIETINLLTFNWFTIYWPNKGGFMGANLAATKLAIPGSANLGSRIVQWFPASTTDTGDAPTSASTTPGNTNPPQHLRWLVTGFVPITQVKGFKTIVGMALQLSCVQAPTMLFPKKTHPSVASSPTELLVGVNRPQSDYGSTAPTTVANLTMILRGTY